MIRHHTCTNLASHCARTDDETCARWFPHPATLYDLSRSAHLSQKGDESATLQTVRHQDEGIMLAFIFSKTRILGRRLIVCLVKLTVFSDSVNTLRDGSCKPSGHNKIAEDIGCRHGPALPLPALWLCKRKWLPTKCTPIECRFATGQTW